VLFGNDMLGVEGEKIVIVLMQAAVFTATACPLPDIGSESHVHYSPGELARSWRALDLRMATNVLKEM
jgi:hypothetical protein